MTDLSIRTTNCSREIDDSVTAIAISGSETTTSTPMININNATRASISSPSKPLHHLNQQQHQNKDPNDDLLTTVKDANPKDCSDAYQEERIHFTIGKKRRKSPSIDGQKANKRSAQFSNVNVFDRDERVQNENPVSGSGTSKSNCLGGNAEKFEDDDEKINKNRTSVTSVVTAAADVSTENTLRDAANYTAAKEDSQQLKEAHQCEIQEKSEESEPTICTQNPDTQEGETRHVPSDTQSTNNTCNVMPSTVHLGASPHANSTQPEGWRVKLYRLNADGSWDDCGTGRIVCLVSDGKENNTLKCDSNGELEHKDKKMGSENSAEDTEENMSMGKEWASLEHEIYQTLGEPTLCMHAEVPANSQLQNLHLAALTNKTPKVLLRTRVLLRESYQRQGDNIITWCEPFFSPAVRDGQDEGQNQTLSSSQTSQQGSNGDGDEGNGGVDLALSFQDNAGCREIWNKISKIQHKAYELFEARGGLLIDGDDGDLQEMTRHLANQHGSTGFMEDEDSKNIDGNLITYVDNLESRAVGSPMHPTTQHLHNENHRDLWGESTGSVQSNTGIDEIDVDEHDFMESSAAAVSMAAQAAHYVGGGEMNGKGQTVIDLATESNHASINSQLCNPPTLENLEKIADAIAASQLLQREAIALTISRLECAYLKALLALFPSAEAKNNYHALATLASIVKSIFLFNEPSIIQFVASDVKVFEDCCCCLEFDPDLKEKANHRWFIQNRLKFRTVLLMEDEELIDSIHKAFRVTYIRDTLLRPTMDESSLSTLSSLLTFTHGDVVKGVMCAPRNKNAKSLESYLVRILRLLGKEIRAIRENEWKMIEQKGRSTRSLSRKIHKSSGTDAPLHSVQTNDVTHPSTPWKQHLMPQDDSLSSRKLRRRGCLSFLREMFNMVRMSLQQSDKDDFYAMIVLMDVKLKEGESQKGVSSDVLENEENDTVNLLSLLGAILSDSNADVSERGACLDILSAIAMHEPSLIRKHCLIEFSSSKILNDEKSQKTAMMTVAKPQPDDNREVIFACPPTDLCLSLLYVMATENDAGIMLQTCEVLRIVLDTEMLNDPPQLDLGGVVGNEEDEIIRSDNISFLIGSNTSNGHNGGECEQNSFLQMFYDHYIPWLVVPFQYSISVPRTAIPFSLHSEQPSRNDTLLHFLKKIHHSLKDSKTSRSGLFKTVSASPIRLSFSVELLSFCVRSHCYRMKRYLINTRILINVMKILSPTSKAIIPSGDRCLKLGALRCLRSVISLKDEFYNRHIIQHSLFTPVFEAFRANPVGDNLVSSSIIEICEFIRIENIKSLIEDIVTKHMQQQARQLSTGAIDTSIVKLSLSLEDVATPYVDTLTLLRQKHEENVSRSNNDTYSAEDKRIGMSEKAIEDQRKFRETDEEESYFFDDVESNAVNYNNCDGRQNGMRQGSFRDLH